MHHLNLSVLLRVGLTFQLHSPRTMAYSQMMPQNHPSLIGEAMLAILSEKQVNDSICDLLDVLDKPLDPKNLSTALTMIYGSLAKRRSNLHARVIFTLGLLSQAAPIDPLLVLRIQDLDQPVHQALQQEELSYQKMGQSLSQLYQNTNKRRGLLRRQKAPTEAELEPVRAAVADFAVGCMQWRDILQDFSLKLTDPVS